MTSSPSNPATTAAQQTALFNRLKNKLEPFRAAALGIAEAVQASADMAIASIKRRDPEYLNLVSQYNQLDGDEEYYEIVKELRPDAEDCKDTVEEHLWRAAIMHRMCQKTVYLLINKVRAALQGMFYLSGPHSLQS